MGVTIDSNGRRTLFKVKNLNKAFASNIRKGLYDSGKELVQTSNRDILKKPKGGKTYSLRTKNGRRRTHKASAPGESWANLSGEARKGLNFRVVGINKLIYFNKVDHVQFLEGTLNRPAMLLSIKQNKTKIAKILENKVRKSF